MKEIYLKQLKERLPNHSHLEKSLSYKEWRKAGEPHLWLYEAIANNVVGMLDMGHGYTVLFEDNKLTNLSNSLIVIGKRYVFSGDNLRLFKEIACKEVIEKGD